MSRAEEQKVSLEEIMPFILQMLSEGKSVQFKPKGGSMLPLLRPGTDSVVLSPIMGTVKKYDIVLYQRDSGEYVLHRINVAADTFSCMGDSQFRYEKGVRKDQMLAIVTSFYRGEKKHDVKEPAYQLYCRIWPTRRKFRLVCLCIKNVLRNLLKNRKSMKRCIKKY